MVIRQALVKSIEKLRKSGISSAHLDAEVLLSYILKKNRHYLLAHTEEKISKAQYKRFKKLVSRRCRSMPVAYLINHKEFYNLDFFVKGDVMVPRPETELLVDEAIHWARQLKSQTKQEVATIVDVGTGSGCIAITLAKFLPDSRIVATDISKKALLIAKRNSRTHKVAKRIKFLHNDLLQSWIMGNKRTTSHLPMPDIIVANLPYLTQDELHNVRHEPKQALYGGKLGIELIERLIMQANDYMNPRGTLILEISPRQTKTIAYLVEQHVPDWIVTFKQDLAGLDRVAVITPKSR